LERVKDQEKRREQENHDVGRSDIGLERVNVAVKCNSVVFFFNFCFTALRCTDGYMNVPITTVPCTSLHETSVLI
jgi:hypothetical protein